MTKTLFIAQFYCGVIDHGFRKLKKSDRPLTSFYISKSLGLYCPNTLFLNCSIHDHPAFTKNKTLTLFQTTIYCYYLKKKIIINSYILKGTTS